MSQAIITLPNPHLRQPSQKIGLITQDVIDLAERMIKESLAWEDAREHEVTVALAAIQIDEPYKLVVVREDFDDKTNRNFVTIVNPEITKYEGVIEAEFEGCLSVSKFYVKVPRHSKVRIRGLNLNGEQITFKAEGFLARVMQHEIDHTKGITIVDHDQDIKTDFRLLTDKGDLCDVTEQEILAAGILKDQAD